ncbi:IS1 family transposase, partial [Escherichia coli]|uniref:IS1 family transposase n=1 Tax=Escherichia coli TaxID=562 RepID=UPI003F8C5D45
NLNLRQHLARLGRKSLSFSKSVELHDKVIGHYLNIKHYQYVGVITKHLGNSISRAAS